jgi:sec-independent protein translocase protein TatB
VLGPEKLPRVVSEVGRWVGRARAMARQFREQLEEEVQLEQARRAESARAQDTPAPSSQATPPPAGEATAPPATGAAAAEPERPATYSHAHATDATGARTPAGDEASQTARADERGT